MSRFASIIVIWTASVLATPLVASAQSFESIDPTDSVDTLPLGVNIGIVVGKYQDPQGGYHGFALSRGGIYTSFDAPGSDTRFGTYPVGVDDTGAITGFFYDTSDTAHGFVRSTGGEYSIIDVPRAAAGGTT